MGTLVLSKSPGRSGIDQFAPEVLSTCRISECFLRCRGIEIKILTLYGWPKCAVDAAAKNNWLLAQAFNRIQTSRVPALVGGDFNDCPLHHPIWSSFAQAGYVELGQFAEEALSLELPNTCKEATRFDTMLVPPQLLQFVVHADVMRHAHVFDSHAPMRLYLRIPGSPPLQSAWRLPRPWSALCVDAGLLDTEYRAQATPVRPAWQGQSNDVDGKLRTWSAVVEESVSAALYAAHRADPLQQPLRALPAQYRGRCRPQVKVARVPPALPRPGRHGDPEPCAECTSVVSRQKLRQTRRLLTLYRGLVAFGRKRAIDPGLRWPVSLDQEWAAICRGSGYQGPFLAWLGRWPEFSVCSMRCPDAALVWDMYQVALFDYRALARQLHNAKRTLFRYRVQVDAKVGGSAMAFASVRPRPFLSLQQVKRHTAMSACVVSQRSFACREFQVARPGDFGLFSEVWFAGHAALVVGTTDGSVTCQFSESHDLVLPLSGRLEQEGLDCCPKAIDEALAAHWYPVWNRDTRQEEQDIAEWGGYSALLQRCQLPEVRVSVNMGDPQVWLGVIRRPQVHGGVWMEQLGLEAAT